MKKLLLILLLLPLGFAFGQEFQQVIVTLPEVMPVFGNCNSDSEEERKSCSDNNILAFIESEKTNYNFNFQGKIYISFTIDENGNLIEEQVRKGINQELDNIALEIVKKMQDWTPGSHRGKAVRVQMAVVVNFK